VCPVHFLKEAEKAAWLENPSRNASFGKWRAIVLADRC
jgi:hypothetical protein